MRPVPSSDLAADVSEPPQILLALLGSARIMSSFPPRLKKQTQEIHMSSAPSTTPQPPAGGPPAPPAKTGSGAKIFLWIFGIFAAFVLFIIVLVVAGGLFVMHKAKQAGLDPELVKKNPVLAAAKFSVAANPDLETVSSNDSTGTIVVHDKKTGRTSTMRVDPEKKIMVVTDDQGKTVTMRLDPANNRLVLTDDRGKTATITADTQAGTMEIKSADGNVKFGGAADKAPDWVPVYPASTPQGTFSANNGGEMGGTYSFITGDGADKVMSFYNDALKTGGFKVSTTTTNADGKVGGFVSGQDDSKKRTVTVTVGTENDGTHIGVIYSEKKQN
jgi:archaellum component FlaG (FlaF/FlaG flagellin family)